MHKLALLLVAGFATGAIAESGAKTAATTRSIDVFGGRLHAQVGQKQGNLIYSPASIAIALAMTRTGATGATATEMDSVLGAATGADAKALAKSLAVSKPPDPKTGERIGPEIAVANRLFGDKKTPFLPRFLEITGKEYGAPIEGVDFRTRHEDARVAINKWVASQTRDRIKDLIQRGVIDDDTRLVLVNAIYLKAQWATPFDERRSKPASFAIEGARSKQVPTMNGEIGARWGKRRGARMLDIPYHAAGKGPKLSMLVVVPEGGKLAAIETTYAKEGLAGFLAATKNRGTARVAMPKFKVGSDFDLADALGAMGMKRAFTESAEFDGITTAERLFIAHVIHKAWIEVDEQGTEAAAATAVVMTGESATIPPTTVHDFKVDRSFAFFIHDENGTVLFAGRVLDPGA